MDLYRIIRPDVIKFPIVLHVPHARTAIPDDINAQLDGSVLPPDDTDWYVDQLYDFAQEMGIPMMVARYSRWVIDLNRHPDSTPLYRDGRVITALCTATDFMGNPIYRDAREEVDGKEVEKRKALYFTPYHEALQGLLDEVRMRFGKVLLWDCHSIRRFVPAIQDKPFPDLILGSADETSASPELIGKALLSLKAGNYVLDHNEPFKGGYITRHYGRPSEGQHALQLEMAKELYMDDDEKCYHVGRANKIKELLGKTLYELGRYLLQEA